MIGNTAFIILTCIIAVGVDWALVDGFRSCLVAFRSLPEDYNYRRFLFPRIIVILASGIGIYVGSETHILGERSTLVICLAMVLFFVTSLYPQVVMFLRSKPYDRP